MKDTTNGSPANPPPIPAKAGIKQKMRGFLKKVVKGIAKKYKQLNHFLFQKHPTIETEKPKNARIGQRIGKFPKKLINWFKSKFNQLISKEKVSPEIKAELNQDPLPKRKEDKD